MGLMDRDYMHGKRLRQACNPASEKSAASTLFMVLVFVAALFFLYKLADWQLNKRASGIAAQSAPKAQRTPSQPPAGQEAFTLPRESGLRPYQARRARASGEQPRCHQVHSQRQNQLWRRSLREGCCRRAGNHTRRSQHHGAGSRRGQHHDRNHVQLSTRPYRAEQRPVRLRGKENRMPNA